MHVDDVLCQGENGGATWETSHRGCILRKVVSKEVTKLLPEEGLTFFWTLIQCVLFVFKCLNETGPSVFNISREWIT